MKIQIDTKDNNLKDKKHRHTSLYLFLAVVMLLFALLYVYGYILYNNQ